MADIVIAAKKYTRLLDYLGRIGLDVEAVASSANLSLDRLAEFAPDDKLPGQNYSRLYREAVKQMQAMKQPLPWAAGVGSEAFDLMCHCMISARTLGEALELAERFSRMTYPMLRNRVVQHSDGGKAVLEYQVNIDPDNSDLVPRNWDRAAYAETVSRASGLLIWHSFCGWLIGQSIETDRVRIAAPYVTEEYYQGLSSVFRCPIEFDAEANAMVFDADQLERRIVHTIDSLRAFLDNAIYELIAIDREPVSTSSAIKSIISIDLPSGMPSFTRISEHLHMSESSLRRRLQKENTSYQNLKDEVRCQVAIDKLLHENATVADLADFLGFTEPSSFVRSFKGWTGETPKSYRDKMQSLTTH